MTDMPADDVPAAASEAPPAVFDGHVVCIGASAGGLDALERFFATCPVDTGAAFVVVQHLSPDHKSMMNTLLSRHTQMPVIMVDCHGEAAAGLPALHAQSNELIAALRALRA